MAKRPEIHILSGPLAGQHYDVSNGPLRFGRSSSNDIHAPDEELSRNHCIFDPEGTNGIRVTDLASANGTFVNGVQIGCEAVSLKEGDFVEAGQTKFRIGEPQAAPKSVDLGLGGGDRKVGEGSGEKSRGGSGEKRRSPLANILWAVVVLIAGAAIYLLLNEPRKEERAVPLPPVEQEPVLREAYFERVEADSEGIFRYEMRLATNGLLTVRIDDVPKEDRHHAKSQQLDAEALAELGEILAWKNLKEIDDESVGVEPDPPKCDSHLLKVVYSTRVRTIRIVNTNEPEPFRLVRQRLEAFTKSELGIWAIQYPREKLMELANAAIELGAAKWEDRDVNYGNLAASIAAYREALFYMETINPKPDLNAVALEGLERSKTELDKRYADQRFRADRALNLSHWEDARRELTILLEMVPDRRDDRNRDAKEKLVSAERNNKKRGSK